MFVGAYREVPEGGNHPCITRFSAGIIHKENEFISQLHRGTMKSEAYLSSSFLMSKGTMSKDDQTFPISLIAFDKIYIDQDLSSLPWQFARGMYLMRSHSKDLQKYMKSVPKEVIDAPTNMAAMILALMMEGDRKLYQKISGSLLNIREYDSAEVRMFFRDSFDAAIKSGGSALFNGFLFNLMTEVFAKPRNMDLNDFVDRHLMIVMHQELFVCSFLAQKYSIAPILTMSDIELRLAISKLPPIPMNADDLFLNSSPNQNNESNRDTSPLLVSKYFDQDTVQKMLNINKRRLKQKSPVKLLLEVAVPNFANIPLLEIVKLKAKDKLKSIARLVNDLKGENKDISSLEFSKRFIDHLMKVGRVLAPSAADVTVGLLGELPIPYVPLNPLSIISSINEVNQLIKFKKNFEWFIALADLQALSEKRKTR